ncbi:MAG: hypothetical protein HY720_11605 [Planctomycetes bacterium]|nr:hypothetical protein [Planctomycetota bacterium]
MTRRLLLASFLLALAAVPAAAQGEWDLSPTDRGNLTISRAGERHWRGSLAYRTEEPDPTLLGAPHIAIEIAYKGGEGEALPPVVLDEDGGDRPAARLDLSIEGYTRAVLFSRQPPYPFGAVEPQFRSLEYILFLEGEGAYYTFGYDAGLTSNRSQDEAFDRFSLSIHEALSRKDAGGASRTFLVRESLDFLARKDPLAAHHLLRFEEIAVESGGKNTPVFPVPGARPTAGVPWARVKIPVRPGEPATLLFRAGATERQAFVDRVSDPVEKPAAGALVRVVEELYTGEKRVHEATADAEGRARLAVEGFDNPMRKEVSLAYPPDSATDHQPTFGYLFHRWGRPEEARLDTGEIELAPFPEGDDEARIQEALIANLFAHYDPDVNQFRKVRRTNSTDELPFFLVSLLEWKKLGGELGERVASSSIERMRRTYTGLPDSFYFQKYLLGILPKDEVKKVLEAKVAAYELYPPTRWTLEWADDLLAALKVAELEKDESFLPLAGRLADGLADRIGRQPDPSTQRQDRAEGWLNGDRKATRPHADAIVALARAHLILGKDSYLDAAFAQADHLLDSHGMGGAVRLARIEASEDDSRAFFASQLAPVALAYELLAGRFGDRAARHLAAKNEIRAAFLRVLSTRAAKLELRDHIEMIRFFFHLYPQGA